jgi:hypothetical protein
MAKHEEKVMQFVEAELDANPDVATSDLFERAKKVGSSVKKLSLRQFNARYPLQIKRRKSLSRPGRRRPRRTAAAAKTQMAASKSRDAVRDVFLRFASDLSSADERKDLVRVISQVDAYVDEAMKAAGR